MARVIEDGDMAIANIQTDKLRQGDTSLTLDEVVEEMNNKFGYNGRIHPIDDEGNITSITAVNPVISDLEIGENSVITITPTTGGSAYYVEINGLYYMLALNNEKLVINDNGSTYEKLTGGGEYTLTATSNNTNYVTVTGTNPTSRTVTLQGIASTKNLQTKPQITITYGKAGRQTVSTTVTVNVLGKYTVNVVAGENGTVSPSGIQQVTEGQSITATGNTGGETNYKFKSWSDGTNTYTTSSTWEYTPTGNTTLTATFEEKIEISASDYGKKVTWDGKTDEDGEWRLFYTDEEYAYLIRNPIDNQRKKTNELEGFGTSEISDIGKRLNSKYTLWNDKELQNYTNSEKACAALLDEELWKDYSNIIPNSNWAIGAPTVEMFVKSYNLTHKQYRQVTGCRVRNSNWGWGYQIGWKFDANVLEESDDSYYSSCAHGLTCGLDIDNAIYCPDSATASEWDGAWWLASPTEDRAITLVYSYDRTGYLGGDGRIWAYYSNRAYIRPLVSISIEELGKGITLRETID